MDDTLLLVQEELDSEQVGVIFKKFQCGIAVAFPASEFSNVGEQES